MKLLICAILVLSFNTYAGPKEDFQKHTPISGNWGDIADVFQRNNRNIALYRFSPLEATVYSPTGKGNSFKRDDSVLTSSNQENLVGIVTYGANGSETCKVDVKYSLGVYDARLSTLQCYQK